MSNTNLHSAKKVKNDEFYTQLSDVERELQHYEEYFKGKTIFCNCDDPYESNFFKYFAMNFNFLGLKKLIATCYGESKIAGTQLTLEDKFGEMIPVSKKRIAHKIVITEVKDETGKGCVDLSDVEYLIKNDKNTLTKLKGDGDFRSPECIELLKEADVVVTNPPFSLFREYVAQLIEYDKKFIILGNPNAIVYKEIFPLIKENKVWLGINEHKKNMTFKVPIGNDKMEERIVGVYWFTNLNIKKRHEILTLFKTYTPEEYPKYDNYDAIEVKETKLIPTDYDGVMGVPITFMDKYCPEQFDIVGMESSAGYNAEIVGLPLLKNGDARPSINGKTTYARLFIRHKVRL